MSFFKKLLSIFAKPKERVRMSVLKAGKDTWGTVEKEWIEKDPKLPVWASNVTYWSVVWDDQPHTWYTYRMVEFVWLRDAWTLFR